MQCYSKDFDNYEFLLCFRLKCTIKYSDFLYTYINYQQIITHKITIPNLHNDRSSTGRVNYFITL